ncbi:MAG: GAF domain-containing sensor histidine kinase, partial [Anaerolineales bacterium]|nr:GAF domain-containing sensor histidine kinase [Anaerolineales bacterium]
MSQANSHVRRELMLLTKSVLSPVALGLTLLYSYFTIAHFLVLPSETRNIMMPVAFFSAVFYLSVWFLFNRITLADKWIYPISLVYFFVASLNSNLHLYFSNQVFQTTNIMLLVIAAGYFLMSTRWLFVSLALVILPWWYSFQQVVSTPEEIAHYQLAMFTTLFVTGLIHYFHRGTATDEILLRLRETDLRERQQREASRLETAVHVSQHLKTSLEEFPLLENIANIVRTQFNLSIVSFFEYIPASEHNEPYLRLQAISTADPQAFAWPTALSLKDGMVGWVAQHKSAIFAPDVHQEKRYLAWAETCPTRSEMTLPLMVGSELLGVLDLQSDQLHAFDQYDFTIFQILAEQTAVSMQNAALYGRVRAFNESLEAEVQTRTQDLQNAYQKLEKLDQAKTDFITVAAHELRTPLTHISSYTQLIERTPTAKTDERLQRYTKHVHHGIQRLTMLMESMLDIAKIDQDALDLVLSRVSIADLLAYVVEQLHVGLAERDLHIETTAVLTTLPPLQGDLQLLRKMFHELLINAIKYTPDGGNITLSGRFLPDTAVVEIKIQDSGIGLAQEEQELVFAKFYQTGSVDVHYSGTTRFMFKAGGTG